MSDLGNKAVFSKNLRNIMEERHVTRNQMCADLGFVYSTFSDWYNGKKYPRIDKIEMMANYFGIMKSDLIENKPTVSPLPANAIPYRSTGMAPVLGRIPAGTPALAEEYNENPRPGKKKPGRGHKRRYLPCVSAMTYISSLLRSAGSSAQP